MTAGLGYWFGWGGVSYSRLTVSPHGTRNKKEQEEERSFYVIKNPRTLPSVLLFMYIFTAYFSLCVSLSLSTPVCEGEALSHHHLLQPPSLRWLF